MNCKHCKAEWTPLADIVISNCPFCQKPLVDVSDREEKPKQENNLNVELLRTELQTIIKDIQGKIDGIKDGNSKIKKKSFIPNSISWLGQSDVTDAKNVLDNNPESFGYIAMSNYSTVYSKMIQINFPSVKSISGFKFKYSFPATVKGACHGYPGAIAHTCKIKLYYYDKKQWVEAYPMENNLNTIANPSVCEVIDFMKIDFDNEIKAKQWKIEMIGNYWLGGNYQKTTVFKLYEVGFNEISGGE